jgi:uncharacterized membrane-anchored protein
MIVVLPIALQSGVLVRRLRQIPAEGKKINLGTLPTLPPVVVW